MKKLLYNKIIALLTENNLAQDAIMDSLQQSKFIISKDSLYSTLREMVRKNLIQRLDSPLGFKNNIYYITKKTN